MYRHNAMNMYIDSIIQTFGQTKTLNVIFLLNFDVWRKEHALGW
jgi:hypothetical protein